MKVLIIAPRYNDSAGDGVYVTRLASALLKDGIQVEVFTIQNSTYTHISYSDFPNKNILITRSYQNSLRGAGKGIIVQNFYSKNARLSLRAILKVTQPDCIHLHGIHQHFTISCLLELKQYGAPILMTVHDYKIACGNAGFFSEGTMTPCTKCLKGAVLPPVFEACKRNSRIAGLGIALQMASWKYLKVLDAIQYFHVGSQFVYNLLSANINLAPKLKLCRLAYLQTENRVSFVKSTNIKIGYVGRFVPHKGVLIFAEAIKNFNVPVHVFGDGPLRQQAIDILQSHSNTIFHGWVGQQEISSCLTAGNIVVVPYLAYETFCYVVVEAMMRGCCVVASNRGAIPELIQNGYNGILVDYPTPENFRTATKKLLAEPKKICLLGSQARNIKNTLPSLSEHAKEIINLYRSLCEKRSK